MRNPVYSIWHVFISDQEIFKGNFPIRVMKTHLIVLYTVELNG